MASWIECIDYCWINLDMMEMIHILKKGDDHIVYCTRSIDDENADWIEIDSYKSEKDALDLVHKIMIHFKGLEIFEREGQENGRYAETHER